MKLRVIKRRSVLAERRHAAMLRLIDSEIERAWAATRVVRFYRKKAALGLFRFVNSPLANVNAQIGENELRAVIRQAYV